MTPFATPLPGVCLCVITCSCAEIFRYGQLNEVHCSAARQLLTAIESTGAVYGIVNDVLQHSHSHSSGGHNHNHSHSHSHDGSGDCSSSHDSDLCSIIEAYTTSVPSRCECSVAVAADGLTEVVSSSIMPMIQVRPAHVVTVGVTVPFAPPPPPVALPGNLVDAISTAAFFPQYRLCVRVRGLCRVAVLAVPVT